MLRSGVYRIDLGNGWFYIGSACDLKRRGTDHGRDLRRGTHCNQIMQNAFNKHGLFEFIVLGRYPSDEIIEQEQALLDEHYADPKCANIAPVAGNCLGVKHTAEARAKMSIASTGRKMPPRTPEHRAALSAAKTGRKRPPRSPEWSAAISAAKTAYYARRRESADAARSRYCGVILSM